MSIVLVLLLLTFSLAPAAAEPVPPSVLLYELHVEIVEYDEGQVVIFLNNYLKAHVKRTQAGQDAAAAFLRQLPATLDVRAAGVALFPQEYAGQLPPRKE